MNNDGIIRYRAHRYIPHKVAYELPQIKVVGKIELPHKAPQKNRVVSFIENGETLYFVDVETKKRKARESEISRYKRIWCKDIANAKRMLCIKAQQVTNKLKERYNIECQITKVAE